jgi:hypothetical protein
MIPDTHDSDILTIQRLLKNKGLDVDRDRITETISVVDKSQAVFPMVFQRALLAELLLTHQNSGRKEVSILEQIHHDDGHYTMMLGALAVDWPGMANSILGIIHHHSQNVLFVKGFTISLHDRQIGVVILAFVLPDEGAYKRFVSKKEDLMRRIQDASVGSTSKELLLDDETVKFEIYTDLVSWLHRNDSFPDEGQNKREEDEAFKFIASRSREYLEERKISDLGQQIRDNCRFIERIRLGKATEVIHIKNIKTKFEHLTGITFVCREILISIDDFLKALNYILPECVIKYHKSFVTEDSIFVYRLEITNRYGKPLAVPLVKRVSEQLKKMITATYNRGIHQVKAVGGFEHFARAIIPFLMNEYKTTGLTQLFFNSEKRTEFSIDVKMILVTDPGTDGRIFEMVKRISRIRGLDIKSMIPPKRYGENLEVNILKFSSNLAEFHSIRAVFDAVKAEVSDLLGKPVRDFDEGIREIDIRVLTELQLTLADMDPALIREIFFNLDEMFRIEASVDLLRALVQTCSIALATSRRHDNQALLVLHRTVQPLHKTIFVIVFVRENDMLEGVLNKVEGYNLKLTRFDWHPMAVLVLILSENGEALSEQKALDLQTELWNLSHEKN